MGRVIKNLELDGEKIKALFDTGSERSYIREDVIPKAVRCQDIEPFDTQFGGKKHRIDRACIVEPEAEKGKFYFTANPVDRIGKAGDVELDLVVGATAMEEWDIEVYPKKKELGLTGLEKREFTEF